ncbi:hypothetical protein PEDI_17180 [Persicobacter diffluens]|uniref:Uncharacterized protein n=1 Tax=Persicobacter diffluens TaxID=981 RepID=A0AAN5AL74_9BACT|nr:hypothetical protein PEDI_17180 [Persicobacter diffluens]
MEVIINFTTIAIAIFSFFYSKYSHYKFENILNSMLEKGEISDDVYYHYLKVANEFPVKMITMCFFPKPKYLDNNPRYEKFYNVHINICRLCIGYFLIFVICVISYAIYGTIIEY